MKKKAILLLLLVLMFISGCSINTLNVGDIDSIVDEVLLKKNKLNNSSFNGYSYYIPNTLKIVNKNEYNTLLKDEFDNTYYVYIDVVSYYNKSKNIYEEDKDSYYSRKFQSKDKKKTGYLEINEVNDKYFVEAVYNYGKIEVYTKKEYLNNAVLNISQVLSSLKYNNKVLATLVGDNVLNYKEETYNIFTAKKSTTNYLDYIEQYDKSSNQDTQLPDSDQVDISSDE